MIVCQIFFTQGRIGIGIIEEKVQRGELSVNDITNCPSCGKLYVKSKFRDVCPECYREEEKAFEKVYSYMRVRKNRAATMEQVEKATGVDRELIMKFIKTGRLRLTHFPNLGYPCEKCGAIIQKGKLCDDCSEELRKDLEQFNLEEQRRKEREEREKQITYYAVDEKYRGSREKQ